MPLHTKRDGQLPLITYFWSKLPSNNYFDFYLFNITNYDEVVYKGEKPRLVEVGPYSYQESEYKEEFQWSDDGKRVSFKNNKSWVYQPETSCAKCTYEDVFALPNAAYMVLVYTAIANGGFPGEPLLLDILAFLLGEYPVRVVTMKGVLFETYDDPVMNLLNSPLVTAVFDIIPPDSIGLHIPPVRHIGYFPLYNHTNDENFTVFTGNDDVKRTGLIERWAGNSTLVWWKGEAANINGSSDGLFNKPGLKKSDVVKQFQSFTCRAFPLTYDSEENVAGIDTYVFSVTNTTYDANLEENRGYRYENLEKKNYFPSWPCGYNHSYSWSAECASVDCSMQVNYCSHCCNGSNVDGSFLLPPGILPLRCLPGKEIPMPFAVFLSPPHFLTSPPEVVNSMVGLAPNEEKHNIGKFSVLPVTGNAIKASFRLQASVPLYHDDRFVMLRNLKEPAFLPVVWVELHAAMKDYAHDYLYMYVVIIPKVIMGVGIGLVSLVALITILILALKFKSRRRQSLEKVYLEKNELLGNDAWTSD